MDGLIRHAAYILLIFTAMSCMKEDFAEPAVKDGYTWVDIRFGHRDFEPVSIGTKATLDLIPESRISNMFVFIFAGNQRIFAHYFDTGDLAATLEGMKESEVESWFVSQYMGEGTEKTCGAVHIRAPQCTGAEIYLIANIDSDMVNISPEKLNLITTKDELLGMVTSLNQEITSRNGLFPMTGVYLDGDVTGKVDVTGVGIFPSGKTSGDVTVSLVRLDAKVQVKVRVATGKGNSANNGTAVQTVKEFRPESWQVVNLPKGCGLAPGGSGAAAGGFFSTEPVQFETVSEESFTSGGKTYTGTVNGFSFYMLENRQSANRKHDVTGIADREKKNKGADGKFDTTDGVWENAPENATYVVIKGEVVMDVDVDTEAKTQQLAADVTYYVHLGDRIKNDPDNYDIIRNTFYTYTVTINGVNNIELEVTSSTGASSPSDVVENEPGAEGMVYVAKESIYTFDAHYGQRVFCFDYAYIDPESVTWYVKTPFGKEGTPDKIGDTEIPSGMDYKWVEFMLNREADTKTYTYSPDGGTTRRTAELDRLPFSVNNRAYPGKGSSSLMDVVDFVEYIKTQTRLKKEGMDNDFRTEFDQDWFDWYNERHPDSRVTDPNTLVDGAPGPWFRDRIYVTVFVDEFYYETNPITGEEDPLLWKRFVNQPNRLMHILCDNEKSLDGASSSTGSVVTIRQRSIQTPYNADDDDLVSAWGCETEDENADSYLWYYTTEKDSGKSGLQYNDDGNTSVSNGLYNTARIWGCVTGTSWVGKRWDEFLEFDRPNDYAPDGREHNILFLKDDMACLKYSSVMRNRDNNGNGIIDPDEIRWYGASIGQLEYLFLGELGLHEDAKLYPRKYSLAPDEDYPAGHPYAGIRKWKMHVISSTLNTSRGYIQPQELWCEEGVSVSGYKQWSTGTCAYSVKCVRNLGFRTDKEENFLYDRKEDRPQDLIEVMKPEGTVTSSSVYRFDNRRVNRKSKRFRTSIELEPYDENSEMARLYEGFETGPLLKKSRAGVGNYAELKSMLQAGRSPCPEGYRVPNIREVVLIFLMADDSREWWGYPDGNSSSSANSYRIFTSTYYSMGVFGNGKNSWAQKGNDGKDIYRSSWNTVSTVFGDDANINLNGDVSSWVRCVRDWNPETDS